MKKISFLFLLLLPTLNVYAQDSENSNWYLGDGVSIDFGDGIMDPISNGGLNGNALSVFASSSISCTNGELLFYSDSMNLFNAENEEIGGGHHFFSSESVFVPIPNKPRKFYYISAKGNLLNVGLTYSIIDMDKNECNGGIVQGKKDVPLVGGNGRKLTSFIHPIDQKPYFITVGPHPVTGNQNTFYIYRIDNDSQPTLISPSPGNVQSFNLENTEGDGYFEGTPKQLKLSPNGSTLAMVHDQEGVNADFFLFNVSYGSGTVNIGPIQAIPFDPTVVTDPTLISKLFHGVGVEFSASGEYLYTTFGFVLAQIGRGSESDIHGSAMAQIPLNSEEVRMPDYTVLYSTIDEPNMYSLGELQRAINDKIYVAYASNGPANSLGVIDQPDLQGTGSTYIHAGLSIPQGSPGSQLPQTVQVIEEIDCVTCFCGIWPRTYGGLDSLKRFTYDIEIDVNDNVYTMGYLVSNDESFEDPTFQSNGNNFVMKHNSCGELEWIKYLDADTGYSYEGDIDIYNNHIVVGTSSGFLGILDFDGVVVQNFINTGIVTTNVIADAATGSIAVITLSSFLSNSNEIIQMYDENLNLYDTYEILPPAGGSHVYINGVHFDGVNKRILLTGTANGTVIFENAQAFTDESFTAQFTFPSGIISLDGSISASPFDNIRILGYSPEDDLYYLDFSNSSLDTKDVFSLQQNLSNFSSFNLITQIPNMSETIRLNNSYFDVQQNRLFVAYMNNLYEFSNSQIENITSGSGLNFNILHVTKKNDDIYISGSYDGNSSFDLQIFSDYDLGANGLSTYITKGKDSSTGPVFDLTGASENSYGSITTIFAEYNQLTFKAHPNPTTDILSLRNSQKEIIAGQVTIFDMQGTALRSLSLSKQNVTSEVDVTTLENGLYFLSIALEDGTIQNIQFVKK